MLWVVVAILLGLWILGWLLRIAGGLIHLLLIVVLIVLIWRMVTRRRVG